jgi:hypothetical protein
MGDFVMNGAESIVRTLLLSGVDTCFANPGTREMHFVAALDRTPGMRCVLGFAVCRSDVAKLQEERPVRHRIDDVT